MLIFCTHLLFLDLRKGSGAKHPVRDEPQLHGRPADDPEVEIHHGLHASRHAVRGCNATTQVGHERVALYPTYYLQYKRTLVGKI